MFNKWFYSRYCSDVTVMDVVRRWIFHPLYYFGIELQKFASKRYY